MIGAAVEFSGLTKRYGDVVAADNVSLAIRQGEFIALLGPSGSGKTTILSMIAGFEVPSAGRIVLGGIDVTDMPPHKRDIGMVFQRYALFPHLSVAENLAYPLRRRGESDTSIRSAVRSTLDLVQLQGLGARYPHQLSGGQQQRVALARALIYRPKLLLMDEPLGALDKKLRDHMQIELKQLHKRLNTTILLVTHDQEEALSMADRVAVIADGRLQQVGTPAELYGRPCTAYVAGFIGETNFLPAHVVGESGPNVTVSIDGAEHFGPINLPRENITADVQATLGNSVCLGIRPEHVGVKSGVGALVIETAFAGAFQTVLLQVGAARITGRVPFEVGGLPINAGQPINVTLQSNQCRLYQSESPLR